MITSLCFVARSGIANDCHLDSLITNYGVELEVYQHNQENTYERTQINAESQM
jgi:hypothetical protein